MADKKVSLQDKRYAPQVEALRIAVWNLQSDTAAVVSLSPFTNRVKIFSRRIFSCKVNPSISWCQVLGKIFSVNRTALSFKITMECQNQCYFIGAETMDGLDANALDFIIFGRARCALGSLCRIIFLIFREINRVKFWPSGQNFVTFFIDENQIATNKIEPLDQNGLSDANASNHSPKVQNKLLLSAKFFLSD